MPELKADDIQTFASIKVVGVGGAGGSKATPHSLVRKLTLLSTTRTQAKPLQRTSLSKTRYLRG